MHTIYILMKDGEVVDISPATSPDTALEFFKNSYVWSGKTGQVYAAHMSDTAAQDVREAFQNGKSLNKASAATLVKRYSSYLNHCADVT